MQRSVYEENEELKRDLGRTRELIRRLEIKAEKLESENRELRKDRDELRRIMRHYKKKYLTLRKIIVRAMSIANKEERITLEDMRRMLRETGEFTR